MEWVVNKAIIIGNEHERSKRNRQDFCGFFIPNSPDQRRYGGVICDGCSEGIYSEVGAALLGSLILNLIKTKDLAKPEVFSGYFENNISHFIKTLPSSLHFTSTNDKVHFIHNFLLTTFIFVVIEEDRIVIGHSGDGVIMINDDITIIDQQGIPNYIAYREIPDHFFSKTSRPTDDFSINIYSASSIHRIVIASDGLVPVIRGQRIQELFGTRKRQLQRKINVWQQKEKLFYDDVACIVFEKKDETDEYSVQR